MDQQSLSKLRELQELEFSLIELNLYLDTHPKDETAVNTFNNLFARFSESRRAYEAVAGPLVNFGHSGPSRCPWQWVEEPWPWEI